MLLLINLMVKSPSFESLIPDRHASSIAYRYGFHGQEKNDEVKREGNSLNFKFRMHDPRVGRFLSLDPLAPLYPHNSPYVFSENRVIDGKELEGAEYFYTADGKSLGLVGEKSTEVRIVKAEHIETFSANFNLANKTDEATKEASATALDNLVRNSDAISLSHDEFATIANIIKKESSGDYNETLAIAHTASNRAKAAGKTLFNLLNTTYSSVSSADKVALSEKNTSTNKGARRAVFDVLNGGSDPTNGAQYWDGVDFLAWGQIQVLITEARMQNFIKMEFQFLEIYLILILKV
ncbi:hypothetical protein DI487_15960 [Flavobacterium sediminis]|uniref:RHS repeat-associated core domain-containing protein n=1 Tax=Flavobacterium sediminis TaxID=2201181 RepID=A0A2U8QZ71_9FLAO|nr:hypothetical protein [Flavobacterium sediminis]AWM15206.1 hypothetical protein DI487_15960 [Flavobacterium sediminis]